MTEIRYCILCGEGFESDDPQAVFCPMHGGTPQALPEQRDVPSPTNLKTDWSDGDVILDTYEVKGGLGQGGFGAVYRVHHSGWNMDLAVKRALNLDEENKQDFIDEAQKWIDLGLHPHIISCYYVRNIDGFPHTFAELAEGGSLESWIQGQKYDLYEGDPGQVLERILDIAIQFSWGLGYAHQQGLVHQDVKPQNALMTPEGVLKVTDFGLTKAKGTAGAIAGGGSSEDVLVSGGSYTPAYCSPEQAGRQKLSHKTDIWSWGVSVLEMFNGGVSWMGGQLAASALESYLGRVGDEEDIPPMPDTVTDLLRECFQEDPQARPKDMLEIADRLTKIYKEMCGEAYPRLRPDPAELKADSLNNKALTMLDLGKPERAEPLFEQAIAEDRQHVDANFNLGLLRWRSGRTADVDVLERLEQIQQDQPDDRGVASALGWVCLESGRFAEALSYFERDVRLGGNRDCEYGLAVARTLAKTDTGSCLRTFEGHTRSIESITFSPNGRQALSGSADKTLKLWDLATERCLHTFQGHTNWVQSVAFSPDGHLILSGSNDKTLKLWDLATGECLYTYEGHTFFVSSVTFSPDGRRVLSGSEDKTVKLWDLATGMCLWTLEGHSNSVNSVAFSPDGYQAISGSDDKMLKLWDMATGQCLRTWQGLTERVNSVVFSPDGRQILSGHQDGRLKLWDISTGECLSTIVGHTRPVESVALSPDGRRALSGSYDKTLKLWDLATRRCLRTFGHKLDVRSVAFSPDGCQALSGSLDHTIKLWDLAWVEENYYDAPLRYAKGVAGSEAIRYEWKHQANLQQAQKLLEKGQITAALDFLEQARRVPGFERDLESLALCVRIGTRANIKGFKGGWLTRTFEGHTKKVYSVDISPDGHKALSGSADRTLKLWDLATGECLGTFEGHNSDVKSVGFSPDGCQALSGSEDQTLKLWDLATGECVRTFEGQMNEVNSVTFSPDGREILSGHWDGTIRLWNSATGRCLRTWKGPTGRVNSVIFSPDGDVILSGHWDGTLKLWDLAQGGCLWTIKGHMEKVNSVAFNPDGHEILSGSKRIKLWDTDTGQCLRTFEEYSIWGVNPVAFSPDGHQALSGGDDNTLKLWDLATGECMRTFEGHTDWVNTVAFSPDRNQILSGSNDHTLKLWTLDWEFVFPGWADWDEGARPYLETFLTLHTPYAREMPQDCEPSAEEIRLSLTRQGQPIWTEDDFQGLLTQLGQRGYGWLREEGVRRKLEEMARERG